MIGRPAAAVLLGAFALGLAQHAQADAKDCISAHEKGQELEKQGRLQSAREAFLQCVQEKKCPSVVSKECASFLERVEKNLPTLVFGARFDREHDSSEVRVFLDGREVAERIDGRAIGVDPGPHEIRFVAKDGTERTVRSVVREGQKNETVTADFRSKKLAPAPAPAPVSSKPPEAERSTGVPATAYVLGGIGVVALGSWAYFGLDGWKKQRELEKNCKPYCEQSQADSMRRSYLVADISLLVALASLSGATVIILTSDRRTGSRPLHVDAAVGYGRSQLSLSGSFDLGLR